MPETRYKLRPDRDLQCYFQQPSAIAALSDASEHGFTVSGCWRQQFDWAVVDWTRDNVFEHPALRNLPDGNLNGIHLTYEETRSNCIPFDSTTFDAIDWSNLRIWEMDSQGNEFLHRVRLMDYATPVEGSYTAPTATFELQGTPATGDIVELAWLDQHCNYQVAPGDTLHDIAVGLAGFIHQKRETSFVDATADGTQITLTYQGSPGANGNRVGVYGTVSGPGRTERWSPSWALFSGGTSPQRWRVDLDFSHLIDTEKNEVPVNNVRRLRWTWAADLQFAGYQRSEFSVKVQNWQVANVSPYRVAGPGSRRIEDDAAEIAYTGLWAEDRGNYSGSSTRYTAKKGNSLRCTYTAPGAHSLYLGTRYVDHGGELTVQVDARPPVVVKLRRDEEDVIIRAWCGDLAGQTSPHTVTVTHTGEDGQRVFFDFLEIAVPTPDLPVFGVMPSTTLATDWDTDHSLALAPERTAWLIHTLGFQGRANHYAGAMWFYELHCPENRYAWGTITFAGTPEFNETGYTELTLAGYTMKHQNLIGDTAESIARCFELIINAGSSSVWASAEGATLRLTARAMGLKGNAISMAAETHSEAFTAARSGDTLAHGEDGTWLTDLAAMPRMNRAVRDWTRAYFRALKGYGIDGSAAFSTELRHGDFSPEAGIAQRYIDQACLVNTPAVQTNFGPESTAFWRQVYRDMAQVMAEAGVTPYLQFGEVQWWYKGDGQSMPFYDAYTKRTFEDAYRQPLGLIESEFTDPASFALECAFLAGLIGAYTAEIMSFVRQTQPGTRFEVLYPHDTNNTPLNRLVNFAAAQWTPANLVCLKTENFIYTGDRNLDLASESIEYPAELGFAPGQISHLIGIGEATAPWQKEQRLALGEGMESVVLWALDQFCLVGYELPLEDGSRRSQFMGA